jgi:PAS domain S-box-containing protein
MKDTIGATCLLKTKAMANLFVWQSIIWQSISWQSSPQSVLGELFPTVEISLGISSGISLGLVSLMAIAFYLRRGITRRLHQQTERERLVWQITQEIRQSLALETVLETTVTEVQRFLESDRVLIYRLWNDGTGRVIHETVGDPFPRILGTSFPPEVFPQEHHEAYRQGKIRTISNVEQDQLADCLVEFVKQFGVKAKLVVPIIQESWTHSAERSPAQSRSTPHLWGLLIVHHCRNTHVWQTWEIELTQQLAAQVAIAIQQSELYNQLQQLNTELESRVGQRTQELADVNLALRDEIADRQRTEAVLLQTNTTLEALIHASPRAILTLDVEGKVQVWNPAAADLFGWTAAEVIDQPSPVALDHQLADGSTLFANVLRGRSYKRLELLRQKKDGTDVNLILSVAPIQESDGTSNSGVINGIVIVILDITEQRQQAEQFRLLQSVVVNTNDAVVITAADPLDPCDPRGDRPILYVNEAFTRMTGYAPETVIGQTLRLLQGDKTDRTELDKVYRALRNWESTTIEVIHYRKNGSEFWHEFSMVPVADHTGTYTHWISIQRDTSARRQAELALRQSEERWRSLIENALDIIMILDLDGTIRYVNASIEKVLGYHATEPMGQKLYEWIHPDDFINTHYYLASLGRSPAPAEASPTESIEFRHRHKDGSWRTLEAMTCTFIDHTFIEFIDQRDHSHPSGREGATLRIMVNARDITERKRLDEIRLALEREKELSDLKTRFFSMASHEFRTPLSTALTAAQVLENSADVWQDSEKRSRNLRRIQDSINSMVQMLNDILMINRAETGKLEFKPKRLDLENFCQQLVEEIQLSAGSSYQLVFDRQGIVIPVYLDERLLSSILSNLLWNAVKYSPQGGAISLKLEFQPTLIFLEVADQGIGIPPEDLDRLFEPFHRGKNVKSIPGTGLGLVVVKKCVELHHGTIEVNSQLGEGTRCKIMLPLS